MALANRESSPSTEPRGKFRIDQIGDWPSLSRGKVASR